MRAVVFKATEAPLEVAIVRDPESASGEVVIKVGRCGICGSDLHMAAGHSFSFRAGAIPGHEFAGEVVALGANVQNLREGDRVAVMPYFSCGKCSACVTALPAQCPDNRMGGSNVGGGYADYALADAAFCIKLPEVLSIEDGALVEPLAVSLRAARASGIKQGDRVLVIGAGAIGIAAAFWARLGGASRVAVSATSNRRESMTFAVGADAFITPEGGKTLAVQATNALGAAPDIVFECAGVPGALDTAVAAVKRQGMIAAPGVCWVPDSFNSMAAMLKEATIRFTNTYDRREFEIATDALEHHVEPRSMITATVGLDQTPEMFELLKTKNPHCKVQIAPWD